MQIFRFMSYDEFNKYRSGKVMRSKRNHSIIHGSKTNSKGFCFLNIEEFTPEQAMHFLSGIVSFDVCAVFETDETLKGTFGIYAKPIESDDNMFELLLKLYSGWERSFEAKEYCTTEYDRRKFKLLRYSKDLWKQWNPAESQNQLKWEECNNDIQTTKRDKKKNGKRNQAV